MESLGRGDGSRVRQVKGEDKRKGEVEKEDVPRLRDVLAYIFRPTQNGEARPRREVNVALLRMQRRE